MILQNLLQNLSIQSMQVIRYNLVLLVIIVLGSCSREELIPSEYISWVNDPTNRLLRKKTINPLEIEVLYKPIDYIISNEQRRNNIPLEEYKKRKQELEGMQYYTFKIGITNSNYNITNYEVVDQKQQDERISYLSFAMQNDIKLVEGKDTLPCKLFHFERSHDLVTYRTFVVAFEQPETTRMANKTIVINLPYFNTGPIKLSYKKSDLESIPTIKL